MAWLCACPGPVSLSECVATAHVTPSWFRCPRSRSLARLMRERTSDGVRSVEAQYRDATDQSAVVSDTILLDAHAPTLRLASRTLRMSMSAGELRLRLRWNDAVSRRARLLVRVTRYGDAQQERYSVRVARPGRWQVVSTPWKPSAPGRYRLHLVLRDQAGHSRRVSALVVVSR